MTLKKILDILKKVISILFSLGIDKYLDYDPDKVVKDEPEKEK